MQRLVFLILAFFCFICFGQNGPVHAYTDEEFETILLAARAAGATYAQASDADNVFVQGKIYNNMKKQLEDDARLEEITEIGEDGKVAHTVIAIKGKDVYIAFPGKTDGMSGIMKIIFGRKNTTDMPWECHGGILPYYSPLHDQLLDKLQELQKDEKKSFIFTGHCSGGAKAALAMASFLNQRDLPEDISVQLITFAQVPAVFPPEEVVEIKKNARFDGHHNIWLENDFWRRPSAWLDWVRGNVHFSERNVIEPATIVSLLKRHRLIGYIAAIEKIRDKEE